MIYSACFRAFNYSTLNACLEINTPASLGVKIYEIGITNVSATATAVALGHPTTGSTSPVWISSVGLPEQDSSLPSSQVMFATSWVNAPVIANATTSGMIRRASFAATIGVGAIWTFPKGLYIQPGSNGTNALCIFNVLALGVASGIDIWINYDE